MKVQASWCVAIAVVAIAVGAAAAEAATGWTPKQAEALIASSSTKFYGVIAPAGTAYAGSPITRTAGAQCVGAGAATKGAYSAFSCKVAGRALFVRPWSTRSVCVTPVSLGSCPPPPPPTPLAADPRLCSNPDYAACIRFAANAAIIKAAAAAGETTYVNKGCTATSSWTTYVCSWKNGGGTVTFASTAAGWAANTTLS